MLSEKELRRIARDECVDMLGEELVYPRKDLCCASFGIFDDGLFHYSLGMDLEEPEPEPFDGLKIDEIPMDYCACVTVNPKTGEVTRLYDISRLPEKQHFAKDINVPGRVLFQCKINLASTDSLIKR